MKVIRNTDYEFKGEIDTSQGRFLYFVSTKFLDYLMLVRECKYVDVSNNKVRFLKVKDPI